MQWKIAPDTCTWNLHGSAYSDGICQRGREGAALAVPTLLWHGKQVGAERLRLAGMWQWGWRPEPDVNRNDSQSAETNEASEDSAHERCPK